MPRRRTLLLAMVAVLLAAAIGYAVWRRGADHEPLRLYGNVDIRDVQLAFRVGGRVQRVLVDEGDRVHAGELLAELDPEPALRDLAESRARTESLRKRAQLLMAGNRPEDIAQAAAVVEERTATLAQAQQLLAREQRLAGSGASTAERLEQAQAARDEAQARLAAARASQQAMVRGFRHEEVEEARANLRSAGASLAQAELRRADTRLQAPSDGVLITRAVEPGAMVAAGTPALTLSLVQPVWVRAYVRETQLAAARPGTTVQVLADALPGRRFEGRIGFVSPTAEFTPKSVETPDLRTDLVYRLRIVVRDPAGELRQGMPVTVEFAATAP